MPELLKTGLSNVPLPKKNKNMSSEIISEARRLHEQRFNSIMNSLMHHGGQVDEDLAISHEDCELHKWLHEVGLKLHGELDEMHDLDRAHREFHLHIQNIVHRQNIFLKSRLEFGQMERSRDQLIALMDKLEKMLD